eukprot:scaffold253136_cov18-Tisochrysis_lutea.AAC.1
MAAVLLMKLLMGATKASSPTCRAVADAHRPLRKSRAYRHGSMLFSRGDAERCITGHRFTKKPSAMTQDCWDE